MVRHFMLTRPGSDAETNLERWQVERLEADTDELTIQVHASLDHLIIGLSKIGQITLSERCLQNGDTSLHSETFSLSEFPRAEVIEYYEIGMKFFGQDHGAEFPDAETEAHLGCRQIDGILDPPYMDPRRV
jgi:hypothetical protein